MSEIDIHCSHVHQFLENSARIYPDKVAYIQDAVKATYKQINAQADKLACLLVNNGVEVGDRIVMLLPNCLEYVVSYYGILKSGGIAVPLNMETKIDALAPLLADLRPKAIIHVSRLEKTLQTLPMPGFQPFLISVARQRELPADKTGYLLCEITGDDKLNAQLPSFPSTALASIIYTSGSTGAPKGVMLSHRNIVANTSSIVEYLSLTSLDVQMVVLPFFYVMGKSLLNTHFAVGGTVVVNNKFAYPATILDQMVTEGVTGFSGVPSTYAHLLYRSPLRAYREKLTALRYVTQAGGHMACTVKEELLDTLPQHTQLFIMYGATEAAARLTYVEPERLREKLESIGKPIPGVSMQVLDEAGNKLAISQVGELVASGSNIMQGYWHDTEGTLNVLDAAGYHTGDLGYSDSDGYFYVVGRKDAIVKVGGHRVNPQEIEDSIIESGLLVEGTVLAVPDDLLGNRLVALAVPKSADTTANDILSFCATRLPRHKIPTSVVFCRILPKNANSKIDRQGCLDLICHHNA